LHIRRKQGERRGHGNRSRGAEKAHHPGDPRLEEYRRAGIDEIAVVPVTAHDPAARRTLATLLGS